MQYIACQRGIGLSIWARSEKSSRSLGLQGWQKVPVYGLHVGKSSPVRFNEYSRQN